MKNLAIARRYAKALLSIGSDTGKVDTYGEELSHFAGLFRENRDLMLVLTNPLYGEQDRRNLLTVIIGKLDLSKILVSFVYLLFDKERISFIKDISKCYDYFADCVNGIARANLVSAVELTDEVIEKIRVALSRKIGKEVVLEVRQDSNLIGGVVATIGDLVLDGSVRTQLYNMKQYLRRGEGV